MDNVHPILSFLPNNSDENSMTNILLYGNKALNPANKKEILNAGRLAKWIIRSVKSPFSCSFSQEEGGGQTKNGNA